MAHADKLISELENEVEKYASRWRNNRDYHHHLYRQYLELGDVLYTSRRRFRAVPAFHRLHDVRDVEKQHNNSSNVAAGSGTSGPEPKRGRIDTKTINHTSDRISLRSLGTRQIKLFDLTSRQYDMQLRNLDQVTDIEMHMESCFDEAIKNFMDSSELKPGDLVGLEVNYSSLDYPIWVNFRKVEQLNGYTIMRAICRVLNSDKSIDMGQPLTITFTLLRLPSGGGKAALKFSTDTDAAREHYNRKNGHLLALRKGDNLCLPKCIIIAQSQSNVTRYEYNTRIRTKSYGRLVEEAKTLLRHAGVAHDGPCSLYDLRLIQQHLVDHRLMVFDRQKGHACIWDGKLDGLDNRPRIIMQLENNHFDLIKYLPAFFGQKYYCYDCMKPYARDKSHKCKARCAFCFQRALSNCASDGVVTTCSRCNRTFKSRSCYENHLLVFKTKSACDLIKRCKRCGYRVIEKKHVCGQHFCSTCSKKVDTIGHVCYMQKYKETRKMRGDVGREIFFDFESCFETDEQGRDIHKPIFVCAQIQCAECSLTWHRNQNCDKCNEPPQVTFQGPDTLEMFCKWLFSDLHRHSVAVAHNMRNYDGNLITQWLTNESSTEFKIIPRGMSILQLECNYLRVICSTNFLSVPLRKLPFMFNFDHMVIKGEFPYKLLTNNNQLSNEPIAWPALELYDPDSRSTKDRANLIAWYETVKDTPFRLIDQITTYCEMDTTIVRMAMTKFRDLFKEVSGIHPYGKAFTISSACIASFRKNNMVENSLMIHKESGTKKTSNKCILWLSIMEKLDNVRIRSSQSTGGEFPLLCGQRKFMADGVVQDDEGIVTHIYEFMGCFWHGCKQCYGHCQQMNWCSEEVTFGDKYEETEERMSLIRKFYPNAQINEFWEHDLDPLIESLDFDTTELMTRDALDPRLALFGGRTEVCAVKGQSSNIETSASYIDVVSMYPSVQMRSRFPVGTYKVIRNATIDDMRSENEWKVPWFGVMQIKMVATKRLFHGPVPYRTPDKKLMFPLCAGCSLATLGNGWPKKWKPADIPRTVTDEQKKQFIDDYKERENIDLNPDNIKSNPPMRGLAMLPLNNLWGELGNKFQALNNIWGKMAQRNDNLMYSYFKVHQLADFYSLVLDPNVETSSIFPVSDTCVCVIHKDNRVSAAPCKSQSVVVALFVTAYARQKLYKLMVQLGDQMIYCDTDSAIYANDPNGHKPELKPYLGCWMSELEPGEMIDSWVVAAPKSYSLRIVGPSGVRYITKSKGFTLNHETSLVLNHESMSQLVDEYIGTGSQRTITTWRGTISRDKYRTLYSERLSRSFRVVNSKRTMEHDGKCRPYGFDNPELLN